MHLEVALLPIAIHDRERCVIAGAGVQFEEGDHLSKNFLDWFLAEQREEMSSMDTLRRMVKRAGESGLS